MGPKKKKGGKKDDGDGEAEVKAPPPVVKENMVRIEFKLLNWKFMNFTMKFRESTHIFSIKKLLREKHGRIDDLKICFHAFTEANEIQDEMLTLLDCGLRGFPCGGALTQEEKEQEDAAVPTVQLFYDFKPAANQSDPVVLFFR